MNRRTFLRFRGTKTVPAAPPAPPAGLQPYTGPWTRNEVQHLLKRVMFGSTQADIDYFAARTMADALSELLAPVPLPAQLPLNDYNAVKADPNVVPGQSWVGKLTKDGSLNHQRRLSFKRWWTGQMVQQGRSITEKLTLFWTNHFGTESGIIDNAQYVWQHHLLLRQQCLGNFRTLLLAVTTDPGMLRYLNGYLNTAKAPDENYARELQELFALGKSPLVKYTEEDVRLAAQVLTGWRINDTTGQSYFDPARHSTATKTFSAYYGNKAIKGRGGAAGADETTELVDMILQKEEVALFLCRKLYRWFVYYEIDTATEQNIIVPLAAIFRQSGYEIKPVLQALLGSEHFFDTLSRACLIKSPIDLVIGAYREFGIAVPAGYADRYASWQQLYNWAAQMNQDLADPPGVSGWPAYYQSPSFHELWVNADTLTKRVRFTTQLLGKGLVVNGTRLGIDPVGFVRTLPNPSDPNRLIADLLAIIYRVPISAAVQQRLKEQILLSNQVSDSYWTTAWRNYTSTNSTTTYAIVHSRLQVLFQYLLDLPEYQLS